MEIPVAKNSAPDEYESAEPRTFHVTSAAGDRVVITIGPAGRAELRAEVPDKEAVLGTVVVTGLTPTQAAKKSKGFWGKLWDSLKGAANAIIDAVTFEAGPFTCRAGMNVDYQSERDYTVTVTLTCRD